MSDLQSRAKRFFDLYAADRVPDTAIDDFVEAWHDSDASEQPTLPEFLGMTDDEYAVWVMDARTLPALRTARRTARPLPEAIMDHLQALRNEADPANQSAILALSHWLAQRAAD